MFDKAERIKQTLRETKERRKGKKCKVYHLKIDFSHLSREKKTYLNRLFLEKKWFRNFIIAGNNIFNFDYKIKTVQVLKEGQFEDRQITCLSSQMRQSIVDEVKTNIQALSVLKQHGKKVGKLKFVSRCDSIELKQAGITYKIIGKTLKLQGFKKTFNLEGLKQIPAETANAKLVEKLGNKKRDARNKFVAKVWEENDMIAVQDENIAEWKSSKMKGWGKRIHHSIMGGIMSGIKKLPQTVIIDKWFASTQICPQCGGKHKVPLVERVYICACGYSLDRDTKAARSILEEAKRIVAGRNNPMPVETETAVVSELAQAL